MEVFQRVCWSACLCSLGSTDQLDLMSGQLFTAGFECLASYLQLDMYVWPASYSCDMSGYLTVSYLTAKGDTTVMFMQKEN